MSRCAKPSRSGTAPCSERSFRCGGPHEAPAAPPKRTRFERMSDVGDIVGWVDELRNEYGLTREAAIEFASDVLGRSESAVLRSYRSHKKTYLRARLETWWQAGQKRGPILVILATHQRIPEDPLLPFERLLSHRLGIDLCIDLTQYPTEESCLAKLEAGGVRCTKCDGDRVSRTHGYFLWCTTCKTQLDFAKLEPGLVRCSLCTADQVVGRPGHHWWCADCRRQFSSLAESPFEGTHLPLRLWFAAIHLLLRSNGTIRVSEVAYLLDVKRTTAERMLARLAQGLHTKGGNISGPDSGGHV